MRSNGGQGSGSFARFVADPAAEFGGFRVDGSEGFQSDYVLPSDCSKFTF